MNEYPEGENPFALIDGDIETTVRLPSVVGSWWMLDLWEREYPLLRVELYVPSSEFIRTVQ